AGIRIDDLIGFFHERKNAEEDDGLATRDDHYFFRCNVYLTRLAYMLRDDLAQLGQTGGRSVMGETLVQRVTGRVDDVGRRIEIRFPDFEMDDVAPLSLQRPRLDQNFESGLGAETRHTLRETEFPSLSHDGEISIINALAQLVFLSTLRLRGVCGSRICGWHSRHLHFGVLKRRWPFVIYSLVLLLLVGGLALQIDWRWKRKLSPWGGRYFFHRLELAVPSFRQGEEKWRDDPLGGVEANGTLGGEGWAVAAAAMVFKFYGVEIDPQQLNWFLTSVGGYTENGWLYWD